MRSRGRIMKGSLDCVGFPEMVFRIIGFEVLMSVSMRSGHL